MNKVELVSSVAKACGLKNADAEQAVEAVVEAITSTLKKGDEVRLLGFGTFGVTKRPATEGRNPRTGEKIKIPAKTIPRFRPGKGLKDAVAV